VEDRVVCPVDGIPSVDIRGDRVAIASISSEDLYFVRSSVRSEEGVLVDVIGVAPCSARMVCGEA